MYVCVFLRCDRDLLFGFLTPQINDMRNQTKQQYHDVPCSVFATKPQREEGVVTMEGGWSQEQFLPVDRACVLEPFDPGVSVFVVMRCVHCFQRTLILAEPAN